MVILKKDILIKDMPKDTRPYEKCLKYGCDSLSDCELLAVIIRSGTRRSGVLALSERVISLHGSNSGLVGLTDLSYEELTGINGIGTVKAVQILCIAELARRISKSKAKASLDFSKPATIAGYYMEDLRHLRREKLVAVFLDAKCKLLGDSTISTGTVNQSFMAPREIFIEALRRNAVGIVMLHNHPSGDPTPSREDLLSTNRIINAGKLIGISVFDHIIIGDNVFVSFKEKGIL